MSVSIKDEQLVITCDKNVSIDEHNERVRAIIELIQQRDANFTYTEPVFYALEMVLDMLPDTEQWEEMLKKPSPM